MVILALLETGLRADEISKLRREDIHRTKCIVATGEAGVRLHVSEELATLLRRQFLTSPSIGLGLRQIQRIVGQVARRAGLTGITPDALRRTHSKSISGLDPSAEEFIRPAASEVLPAVAERISDLLVITDADRRLLCLNGCGADALGRPPVSVAGRPFSDFFAEVADTATVTYSAESDRAGRRCLYRLMAGLGGLYDGRWNEDFLPGLHACVLRPQLDTCTLLDDFVRSSKSVFWLRVRRDGIITAANNAVRDWAARESLEGDTIWTLLTEPDSETLKDSINEVPGSLSTRRLLNFARAQAMPLTLDCLVHIQPAGFVVVGEAVKQHTTALENELITVNNRLAALLRETNRQLKSALRTGASATSSKDRNADSPDE